jgi:hypothetical protein
MIVVCSDFQKRLDDAWYHLQTVIMERHKETGISQFGLDEATVVEIEKLVNRLKKKKARDTN